MKRSLLTALLLFGAVAIAAHADEKSAKVSRDWSGTRSGESFHGHKYEITWVLAKYDGRKPSAWVGGDSVDPPDHVLKSLKLRVDGVEVAVPESVYFDIYDPIHYGPYIMDDGQALYLVIKASDGAGATQVWIRIENKVVVKRRVRQFTPNGAFEFRN